MIAHLLTGIGKHGGDLKQYVQANNLPWGGGQDSVFIGASPAVANGDMCATALRTTPDNFSYVVTSTGVAVIQAGGSTARETIPVDLYDMTFRTWSGQVVDYVNDHAPVILNTSPFTIYYLVGSPIINIDLSTYTNDIDGDPVTVSTVSTLPPGLILQTNILGGTPTTIGTYPVTFTATDPVGLSTNFPVWTFVIQSNEYTRLERGQHGWQRGTYLGR